MAIKLLIEEKTPQGLELKNLILSICGAYKVGKDMAEATLCWFADRQAQPLKYEQLRIQLSSHENVATQLYSKLKERYAQGMEVQQSDPEHPEAPPTKVVIPCFEDC